MTQVFDRTYNAWSMVDLVKKGAALSGISTQEIQSDRHIRALQILALNHEYTLGREQSAWTCGDIAESLIRFENMAIRAGILKP
jgi:hypothetical protein